MNVLRKSYYIDSKLLKHNRGLPSPRFDPTADQKSSADPPPILSDDSKSQDLRKFSTQSEIFLFLTP